jgi:16S rRNA (uracil1498-N3)-methyltransferase
MHRFFLLPDSIVGDVVTFEPAVTHQLRTVLRLRPGERVIVLDGSGLEYEVVLVRLDRTVAEGRVSARRMSLAEPRLSLTLYQSVIKGDGFEWVLQKGTELGVSRFVPLLTQRAVLRDPQRIEKRYPRWERIVREAAEQSGRGRLPHLWAPTAFPKACAESVQEHDIVLLPWECASGAGLSTVLRTLPSQVSSAALLVGPEGGFDPAEVALAEGSRIRVVTLGPRILRAETAGIVASAIVLHELGEMG